MERTTLCGIFVLHMLLFYAEITFPFVGQQCAFSTNRFQFNVPAKGGLKSERAGEFSHCPKNYPELLHGNDKY